MPSLVFSLAVSILSISSLRTNMITYLNSHFPVTGMIYPAFGIVYSKAMQGFSLPTNPEKRHAGDRNALWFFIMAIISALAVGFQNYYFARAAATLTSRLRSLSFKAILRQDIAFFDKDENSVRFPSTSYFLSLLIGVVLILSRPVP